MNEFFDASTNNHRKREIGVYSVYTACTLCIQNTKLFPSQSPVVGTSQKTTSEVEVKFCSLFMQDTGY